MPESVSSMSNFNFRRLGTKFQKSKTPGGRRLLLEPLEDRTLLATWGGFDLDAGMNVYAAPESAVNLDFGDRDVEFIEISDVNADGFNDIIAVSRFNLDESSSSAARVYFNRGDGENFDAAGEWQILYRGDTSSLAVQDNSGVAIKDVTGDGLLDITVATQESENDDFLTIRVFVGKQDGTFENTEEETSNVSLYNFLPTGTVVTSYVISTVDLAYVGDDLAVQISNSFYNIPSADILNGTAVFHAESADSARFTDAGMSYIGNPSAIDGSLLGELKTSITLSGVDMLVSTGNQNVYFYYKQGASWVAKTLEYNSVTDRTSSYWTSASGDTLLFGFGGAGPTSTEVVAAQVVYNSVAGTIAFGDFENYVLDNFVSVVGSCAAVGCLGAADDEYVDLFIVSDASRQTLIGTAQEDGLAIPAFEIPGSTVIDQPNYLASRQIDWDKDGIDDLLVVGDSGLWLIRGTVDDSGKTCFSSDPEQLVATIGISGGVFGDFDGDGAIDFAVVCGTGDSHRIDVFIQVETMGNFQQLTSFTLPVQQYAGDSKWYPGTVDALAVGRFTSTAISDGVDELAVVCSWLPISDVSPESQLSIFRQTSGPDAVSTMSLGVSGVAAAMTVGKLQTGDVYDSVALAYDAGTASTIFVLKNTAGTLADPAAVALDSSSHPSALAFGDLDGDTRSDIVFLNKGTGASDASIGRVMQYSEGVFTVYDGDQSVAIDESGEIGSFLLADISSDGFLDVALTVRNTSGGVNKYSILVSLGASGGTFGEVTRYALASPNRNGIDFQGGTSEFPAIIAGQLGGDSDYLDLVLVQGKTVATLYSRDEPGEFGEFLYVVRASDAADAVAGAEFNAADDNLYIGEDAWIDEWSKFYIEIWGTSDGNGRISMFTTSFTYDTGYYAVSSVTDGPGFTVTMTEDVGGNGKIVTLEGNASSSATTGENGLILLARVLMTPADNKGGVAITDDGLFYYYDWNIDVCGDFNTINGSSGSTVDEQYMDLDLYPVRFDYTDDGEITGSDFSSFAIDYGKEQIVTTKYRTFDIDDSDSLTGSDFSTFAVGYGLSISSASTPRGFYRDAGPLGQDPTSWTHIPAAAPLGSAWMAETDPAEKMPAESSDNALAPSESRDIQAEALLLLVKQNGGDFFSDDEMIENIAVEVTDASNGADTPVPLTPTVEDEAVKNLSVIPEGEEEADGEESEDETLLEPAI